jgi:hypothetical protein
VAVRALPKLNELADRQAIEGLRQQILPNLEACKALQVRDDNERAAADVLIAATKPLGVKLDDARKAINRAFKTEVDSRFQPLITEIDEAVEGASDRRRDYDKAVMAKAQEEQRKADEAAAKERAELERRQKIQAAAVAQGKQAVTVIAAPESVVAPLVVSPHAEARRMHYRLKSRVLNVDFLPAELTIKTANLKAIQERVLEIEKNYPKERKGIDVPEQTIPGLELAWEAVYTDC